MNDNNGAVLFDIDGTLADSNYLHVDAWARAFAEVGLEVDAWRIHRCIGMDGELLLDTLVGDDGRRERASELNSEFYKQLAPRLRPFDGARELLEALHDRGVPVVLATSAPEDELSILKDVLQVDAWTVDETSSGDVSTAKPKPDVIEAAVAKAGAAASGCFMVGDSVWDMIAAARAGVTGIGVRSGGVSEQELRDAGAAEVYDDVRQLLEQLDASAIARLL